MRPALFLDMDGTLIYDHGGDYSKVEIIPGVLEELRAARKLGFMMFIVTNQSAVGRGCVPRSAAKDKVYAVRAALEFLIADAMICTHIPEDGCTCRKPMPGMIYALARKWGITLEGSWIIGDKQSDTDVCLLAPGLRGHRTIKNTPCHYPTRAGLKTQPEGS